MTYGNLVMMPTQQRRAADHAPEFPAGYFTGDTISWETAGAILSEVRHAVGRSVPLHEHQAPYFSLLLDGAYAERGDGFDLWYEPYTLVFHSAATTHEDEMIGPCRFFAVALLQRWEDVIAQLGGARAHVFELDGGDPVWLVLRLYQEFLARAEATDSAVEALLYELCAHVAPAEPAISTNRRGCPPLTLRFTNVSANRSISSPLRRTPGSTRCTSAGRFAAFADARSPMRSSAYAFSTSAAG